MRLFSLSVAFVMGACLAPVTALAQPKAPQIKDYGLKSYLHLSKQLPHTEDKTWKLVCTMPYNCHFQMWIEFEAPAGKQLSFNSSNPLVLYLTKTETHTTLENERVFECKNWVSGEGAVYTIPAGVRVKAVKYRETGFNTAFLGSFECNDNDFNILWKRAARTAYICMREHFYDCPDRERVGFWGDGTPELNQCFYLFDKASHVLCKDLVRRKLEPKFYPGQHLEFLGEYGLWYYYLHTGDLESLAAVYDQTKKFLLETYQFGKGTWYDWGVEVKDIPVIETCFMYIDLGTLRKIALLTGHEADLPVIDKRLEEIRSTFDSKFWKDGFYKSDRVKTPDDRANAMAVNAGLADPAKWPRIYNNVLTTTFNASCFFDRWVLEALCKMGKQEDALLRMADRYRTMTQSSFTTLWEHYDRWWASVINAYDDASSLNHGWNPPVILLSQTIAGVAPEAPGWSVFHVLPREAFLTSIKAMVPTVKGLVKLSIAKSAALYRMEVVAPRGTTAIVGMPKASFQRLDSIRIGGKLVWQGGKPEAVKGVQFVSEDSEYVRFSVGAGSWKVEGVGELSMRSPKTPPAAEPKFERVETRGWQALSSVPDGQFAFSGAKIPIDVSAANAVDWDGWTGWRDMTSTQRPGQWFQVDMGRAEEFDRIVLDNTWALWDSPKGYAIHLSKDGQNWGDPVATGEGRLGITTIDMRRHRSRFIRVVQTGMNPKYHWSIYEFGVYRRVGRR